MMKTALSIIQAVRYKMNLSAPSTLITLTDPDELQMLHTLYTICEELRAARCWPQLKRKHSFSTVDTQASYQLAPDFYSPLLATHYNETDDGRLIGPESDETFSNMTVMGDSTINYSYRIFGRDENSASAAGQLVLLPTPSAVQTVSYEYLTRSFFLPQNWTASTSYGANAYVNASGNIYQKPTGTATSGTVVPSHTTGAVTDGTITWTYISAPYETIIADTDLVVFDDDLIKLGLRAEWNEDHSGEGQIARQRYEERINQAVARYKGPYRGNMCGKAPSSRYTTQYKSWSL